MFGLLLLAISLLASCHEFSHDGSGIFGSAADSLRGTVQRIDPRYSSIAFQTDDRRSVVFYYNGQTSVRYQNRVYPVQSIQTGDYIEMRSNDITATNPTAYSITVITAANSAGASSRLETFEGRVEYIDARGGSFEVRDRNNRIIVVVLPASRSQAVADRFNRLRNGDSVTVEGRFIQQNRFELTNFL